MEVEFRGLVTFGVLMALAEQDVIYLMVADSCHSDLVGNWISPEAALDVAERFFVCDHDGRFLNEARTVTQPFSEI